MIEVLNNAMEGANFTPIYGLLSVVGLFLLASACISVASTLGYKIAPWVAVVTALVGACIFVLNTVVQVNLPKVIYDDGYHQGRDDFIGTPNPSCFSVVYTADGGEKLVFNTDQLVDELLVPLVGDNGEQQFGDDGQPLWVLAEGAEPVEYVLRAKPLIEFGFVYLWVEVPGFYEEVYSCRLYQNQSANELAEGLTEAWESIHGTEPEEGEQAEGSEGAQSEGSGQPSQPGGNAQPKPDVRFTMPLNSEKEGEVVEEGEGEESESTENPENNDSDQTRSFGEITITPYEQDLPKKE